MRHYDSKKISRSDDCVANALMTQAEIKGFQIARDEPHRVDHLLYVRTNPAMTKTSVNVLGCVLR